MKFLRAKSPGPPSQHVLRILAKVRKANWLDTSDIALFVQAETFTPEQRAEVQAALKKKAKSIEAKFLWARQKQWRQLAKEAVASGGGRAHRFIKGPKGWNPDACWQPPDLGVKVPMGAQARADATLQQWLTGPWAHPGEFVVPSSWPPAPSLPRLTAAQLRRSALAFPPSTATGMDAWHPREFAHLSDQAL